MRAASMSGRRGRSTGRGIRARAGRAKLAAFPGKAGRRGSSSARVSRLDSLAAELERAAAQVGIRVRREKLLREVGYHPRSGLCRVGRQEILLLDHDVSSDVEVDLLASALAGRDLTGLDLSDEARRALAAAADRSRREAPSRRRAG